MVGMPIWLLVVVSLLPVAAALYFLLVSRRKSRSATSQDEARRFAGLLVGEIKLYEPYKVERGLKTNDLLGSLRDEIAEARRKFHVRCGDELNFLFDEALLRVLAEGDGSKLGPDYKSSQPSS